MFRRGVSESALLVFFEIFLIIRVGEIILIVIVLGLILVPAIVLVVVLIVVIQVRRSLFRVGII
jgi:hypothetical protein